MVLSIWFPHLPVDPSLFQSSWITVILFIFTASVPMPRGPQVKGWRKVAASTNPWSHWEMLSPLLVSTSVFRIWQSVLRFLRLLLLPISWLCTSPFLQLISLRSLMVKAKVPSSPIVTPPSLGSWKTAWVVMPKPSWLLVSRVHPLPVAFWRVHALWLSKLHNAGLGTSHKDPW